MFRGDQGTTAKERFSTFPQDSLRVGGINGPRLRAELSHGGVYVSSWAEDLLEKLQKPERQEQISTVKFRLRDVGIRDYVSGTRGWDTLVNAVRREGLDLCPQLTGPEMALNGASLVENGEWVDILSKPIAHRHGDQLVFALERFGSKLLLHGDFTDYGWYSDSLSVARLR